jgi:predicted RNA-binding protein with PIN domain
LLASGSIDPAPYPCWVETLIVDGANVVGSRPDGWWRDRPGAARRLHEQLSVADLPQDEVVLVLEGDAKGGVRAGQDGHVRTVHAQRSGDDAIVEETKKQLASDDGRSVVVVTADRMLRARVEAAGGSSMSPGWLLDRL